ncbi:MAG: baseplate J/gp47 family protein [Candidatus Merdivicinus sp.]
MDIPTYEQLMARVLSRLPTDLDRREGSLIWTAVGPVCAELAQAYIELEAALDLAFLDTSSGDYLDRLAKQMGDSRSPATSAVCRAEFRNAQGEKMTIPDGMRFGIEGIFYQRDIQLEEGAYQIRCETPGLEGNRESGTLLPVDYLDNLGSATITDLLVPGTERESDDHLRERLLAQAMAPAFGGNIADYREKTMEITGIGAVKVQPVPEGGGTVSLWVLGEDLMPAEEELLTAIQLAADPSPAQGRGFAPIGHQVSVFPAQTRSFSLNVSLTLAEGNNLEQVKPLAQDALDQYLLQLRSEWADSEALVIRISQIILTLLSVNGVLDASAEISGVSGNLILQPFEIPVLEEVTWSTPEVLV